MSILCYNYSTVKKGAYKQELKKAEQELAKLLEQREALDRRIAKLRQDLGSLAHLAGERGPSPISKLIADTKKQIGLKSSCLEVLRAYDEPLTPVEVAVGIERLGLNYSDSANLIASVHTTLRRMSEAGEAEESSKEGKKAYKLK
jgi:hypothetical protein